MDALLWLLWTCWLSATLLDGPMVASSATVKRQGVTMLSKPADTVVNSGQNIELDCEFYMENFELFRNPVIWMKTQRDEDSQINIMSNINPPFLQTERFTVSLEQSPPRYNLKLSIRSLGLEDSGNYTCEVRGEKSRVISYVTFHLFVRAPVQAIALSSDNATSMVPRLSEVLTFVEKQPGTLRCISIGGYPPPSMQIFVGHENITRNFSLEYSSDLSGEKGMRHMLYRTERWTHNFRARQKFDEDKLKCVTTVPGLEPNISVIKLQIEYRPIIVCHPSSARLGAKNIHIRCSIRARPRSEKIYWILDGNGTTVVEGQISGEFWTLVRDKYDHYEARLYLREATPESFRKYRIVATNKIDSSLQEAELTQEKDLPEANANVDPELVGHPDSVQANEPYHPGYIFSSSPHPFRHSSPLNFITIATLLTILVIFR